MAINCLDAARAFRSGFRTLTSSPKASKAVLVAGYHSACSHTPYGEGHTSYASIRVLSMVLLLLSSSRTALLPGRDQGQEECS